jgi:hypothetical protein
MLNNKLHLLLYLLFVSHLQSFKSRAVSIEQFDNLILVFRLAVVAFAQVAINYGDQIF